MRVLMTLPVKIGLDGMTKQILSYGKYMDRNDLEIDLLSCRGYDPVMKMVVEDAHFNNIYKFEYRDTNQLKYFIKLLNLIHRRRYDVVHANGQSATLAVEMLAAQLGGCKLRVAHSHSSKCLHQKAHKLLMPLFKVTCNDAIACSKEAGDWLFGDRSYWLLNNGIDVEHFRFNKEKRLEYRKLLKLDEKTVAVCHIGAFEPWKNHKFLLEVFDELKKVTSDYRLFLFGIDGTSRTDIQNKIKKLKLEDTVIYMGATDKIFNYLQAMDLMLLPSWYEGFPVTAVECQANGLPCIISDTVTSDVRITELVEQLPINSGTKPWVNAILKHGIETDCRADEKYLRALKDNGFDIKNNAEKLKKHYLEKLTRGNN